MGTAQFEAGFRAAFNSGQKNTMADVPEYTPVWSTFFFGAYCPANYAQFADPRGKTEVLAWGPEYKRLHIIAPAGGRAVLKLFYYPHWKAFLNGRIPLDTSPDPDTGLLALNLPPGAYDVELRFEKGGWFRAGSAVSITALALFAAIVFLERRGKKEKTHGLDQTAGI